jgi:DNA-binding GntR family transcriptional regulator
MTERHIAPVIRESTPGIIAEKLRNAIGSGELPPGTQLGETDLARRLGVSRGPLREGMQRLTQEGLLVSIRNRGLFVIEMTPENVRDMYVARAAVERAAAERIFVRDPAGARAQLIAVTRKMERAARRRDHSAVGEFDIEFHQLLVALAGSPRLTRMHETLLTETRMCIHALNATYHDPDERVTEHRAIAEAFGAAEPELVDRLLVAHMDDAVVRLAAASAPGEALRVDQSLSS